MKYIKTISGLFLAGAFALALPFAAHAAAVVKPVGSPTPHAPAAQISSTTITWSWDALPRATSGYFVFPSTGGFATVTDTSFTLTGLTMDTPYGIGVKGYNSAGDGPLSQYATYYTLTAPPSTLNPLNVYPRSAHFSWSANGNAVGTVYQVQYYKTATPRDTLAMDAKVTTATIVELAPSTSYTAVVRAYNHSRLLSAASNAVTFTTLPAVHPEIYAPASELTTNSITWTWAPQTGATGYNVYLSSGAAGQTPIQVSGASVTVTAPGFGENTAIGIQVQPFNVSGDTGTLSPASTAYTLATTPSSLTTTVRITSASFTWVALFNPSYTHYRLQYWKVTGSTTVAFTTSTALEVQELEPMTSYYFRVASINGKGENGVPSVDATELPIFTLPFKPVDAPRLERASVGVSSITWSWTALPRATTYILHFSTGSNSVTSATEFAATTLASNTAYGLQAAGDNVTGEGPLSSYATFYTLAAAPTDLSSLTNGTNLFRSSATLTWSANGNPADTKYRIETIAGGVIFSTTGSLDVGTGIVTAEMPPGTLTAGTQYHLHVLALNGDEIKTAFSGEVSGTTNAHEVVAVAPRKKEPAEEPAPAPAPASPAPTHHKK